MDTTTEPQVGGLVARRKRVDASSRSLDLIPHGPTHRIESTIATRVVTKCGREMEAHDAHAHALALYPQGVRQNPTCKPCQ